MLGAHATRLNAMSYSYRSYIFIVDAADAHYIAGVREITHGRSTHGTYYTMPSGMTFDPYGILYMTFNWVTSTG